MTLDDDDIEAIAERVAELLASGPRVGLVTPKQLARELGVSVEYVYDHADELGVTRLGKGKRPRQRFDVQRARDALAALETTRAAPEPLARPRRGRPRKVREPAFPLREPRRRGV